MHDLERRRDFLDQQCERHLANVSSRSYSADSSPCSSTLDFREMNTKITFTHEKRTHRIERGVPIPLHNSRLAPSNAREVLQHFLDRVLVPVVVAGSAARRGARVPCSSARYAGKTGYMIVEGVLFRRNLPRKGIGQANVAKWRTDFCETPVSREAPLTCRLAVFRLSFIKQVGWIHLLRVITSCFA
jgi:hypothetical protein